MVFSLEDALRWMVWYDEFTQHSFSVAKSAERCSGGDCPTPGNAYARMRTSGNGAELAKEQAKSFTQSQQAQAAHGEEIDMSLFRYQGSKVWTMDFLFHSQRIRESTGTRSKTLALKIEDKRRRALEEGTAGIRKHQQPRLLCVASNEWLELKRATLARNSVGH